MERLSLLMESSLITSAMSQANDAERDQPVLDSEPAFLFDAVDDADGRDWCDPRLPASVEIKTSCPTLAFSVETMSQKRSLSASSP